MSTTHPLTDAQTAVLAYVRKHPHCESTDVNRALGIQNASYVLGTLYVRRFIGRQAPLRGVGSMHYTFWPEQVDGWVAEEAEELPEPTPLPPPPARITDRSIEDFWEAHPNLTYEQAKQRLSRQKAAV